MKRHTYSTQIWWDEDDKCFIAVAPAIQGCMTTGRTRAEAAKHIEEAIDACLRVMRKCGDPIPAPDALAEELNVLRPILNLSKLANLSGVNQRTLASKLRRKTKLSKEEAIAIRQVLSGQVGSRS
jgi:predicted RNase H-like HicB family nuclease